MADGNHLACQNVCKNFEWRLLETCFKFDVLLIPLGSCDMVLGVQWLKGLGPVKWDFNRLVMEFDFGGRHHVLKGILPSGIKSGQLSDSFLANSIQLYFLQVASDQSNDNGILSFSAEVKEVPVQIQ